MKNTSLPNLQPDRQLVVDALRGFAIMGICMLHCIEHFNFYSFPEGETSPIMQFLDASVWKSLFFLFGGKAYALFAVMFGFSFYIQTSHAEARNQDFRARFAWRLLLLFVIGNINAMFFTGEILVLYSILGFALIVVSKWSNRALLIATIFFLLQPVEWLRILFQYKSELAGAYFSKVAVVQAGTSFLETVKANLWEGQLASLTWALENGRVSQTIGLFFLGFYAGRKKFFIFTPTTSKVQQILLVSSILLFFPLDSLMSTLPRLFESDVTRKLISVIFKSWASLCFATFMVTLFIQLYNRSKMHKAIDKLVPYGRMSLTNYLSQSVVGAFLFYGWGLGLYAYLGHTASMLVGVLLFLLQRYACTLWLKNHKRGPLEEIWHRATWAPKL